MPQRLATVKGLICACRLASWILVFGPIADLLAQEARWSPSPATALTNGLATLTSEQQDAGKTSLQPGVSGSGPVAAPRRITPGQALPEEATGQWVEVEGEVTFVSEQTNGLVLELSSSTSRMRVEVAKSAGASPLLLLHSRIRAVGIVQAACTLDGERVAATLLAPDLQQIEFLDTAGTHWAEYPVLPIGPLTRTNFQEIRERVVHVQGKVPAQKPGQPLAVEDETGRIAVEMLQPPPKTVGCQVEVLGRWTRSGTNVSLRGACYREIARTAEKDLKVRPQLTRVEEVKRLSREEAQRGYPVKVRGIVTTVLVSGFFLQDATWAIYVNWLSSPERGRPRVGDYCEIEGVTIVGFAPGVQLRSAIRLGAGALPEPLRPTWDQVINGSLDARYVEVQGIATRVQANGMELLTPSGKIEIQLVEPQTQSLKRYENALIRVRGCVIPGRDVNTMQVRLGRIELSNCLINVDEPAPSDPFAARLRGVSEMLLFNWRASAIERVKIAGQVVHGRSGEYYLMEGTNGLRFVPTTPLELRVGEQVEVVGFPALGGPSLMLREALVRRTGQASLPPARRLREDNLLSRQYDATLVRVEARLVSVTLNRSDQVLELQAGTRGFFARLDNRRGQRRDLAPGSRLELTGVYVGQGGDGASGREIDSFELLLNSPEDITVLERPSWWTLRHTLMLVGGMGLVLLAALVWIALLRRQVEERSRRLAVEIRSHEQTEQKRALEQERARIARDLHDDLGATLTQIRFLSALESRDSLLPAGTRSRMSQVTEKSREMVVSLDEIVWAVNPANDSLPSLATYLCQFAEEFFRSVSIRCRLDVDEHLPPLALTSEVRHDLYLVVKEAFNNAARHSRAAEVWLRIQWQEQALRIAIEDNGCGFALSAIASGEGLTNMRRRLEKLDGRFECDTRPGAGTVCRFWLPLEPKAPPTPG